MPQQHCMTAESAGVSSTMFTFDYQILFQIFQRPRSCNHVQRHPQSGQHALALQAWRDHSRPPGLSAQNRFHQVAGDHQPDSTNAAHSTYAHFFLSEYKAKGCKRRTYFTQFRCQQFLSATGLSCILYPVIICVSRRRGAETSSESMLMSTVQINVGWPSHILTSQNISRNLNWDSGRLKNGPSPPFPACPMLKPNPWAAK